MTMPTTDQALNLLEDEALKAAEKMKADPTPIALYLIFKHWRDEAVKEGKTDYSVKLLELSMITQMKREFDQAGL